MTARNDDLGELLAAAARMAEIACRHELTVVTHLLDLMQLELIASLYGYSDGKDTSTAVDGGHGAAAVPRKPRRRRPARR